MTHVRRKRKAAGNGSTQSPTPRRRARPARDRARTEQTILDAVGVVLAKHGFGRLGVSWIARAAGVDKVLIYRYFGGLPRLLRAYGKRGSFWPSVEEIVGPDPAALLARPLPERFAIFFERFVQSLRARPLTIEILAFEGVAHNELTRVLDAVREEWGQRVGAALGADAKDAETLTAMAVLLVAAAQYLLVRSRRTRIFGGIDITNDARWKRFTAAVGAVARAGLR